MKRLPGFLKKYFWEVDFNKLDVRKYPKYVISRLMECGDLKAIKWLKKNFSNRQINNILRHSRDISNKSSIFWAIIQGIRENEILCLSKEYREKRKTAWPY